MTDAVQHHIQANRELNEAMIAHRAATPTHKTGPCLWITQANWDNHQAEYDDYHIHIIEQETKGK